VPAQQAAPPTAAVGQAPATTAPAPGVRTPTSLPRLPINVGAHGGPTAAPHHASAWPWVGVVLLVLILGWAVGLPAGRALTRRARRRRAVDEAERVLVAWREAVDRLAAAGAPRRPADTFAEHAGRASAGLQPAGRTALLELVDEAEAAAYGPPGSASGEVAAQRAARVEEAVLGAAGPWRRLGWALDPRPTAARWWRRGG
jgi:hypothetical protein